MNQQHLILGGMRSGKSHYAMKCADKLSQTYHYQRSFIATATALDDEMQSRIQYHKEQRKQHWNVIEEPLKLATIIKQKTEKDCLLIDCLTLWLNNCLQENCWETQSSEFLSAISDTQAHCFFVSNEISMGVIPMGELTRRYVDELGRLHQRLASQCQRVTLMVAGIAHNIK